MSQILKYTFPITFFIGIVLIQNACVHDAIMGIEIDPDPVDSTEFPDDTILNDTTVTDSTTMAVPCDSSKVYFEKDVLPILNNSCAISGCHDAASANDGVILSSFEDLINSDIVVPFDLSESDLYEVLTDDDPDDVMPPSGRLNNELITVISRWILQGADSLSCDNELLPCGTEASTYSTTISSLMQTNCDGCHSSSVASGGIVTDNYASLKNIVDTGQLFGALSWQSGYERMPLNLNQLDSCSLVNIKIWIDEGAQNN